jgi:gluconate 2-dehydrogenase gamma chain
MSQVAFNRCHAWCPATRASHHNGEPAIAADGGKRSRHHGCPAVAPRGRRATRACIRRSLAVFTADEAAAVEGIVDRLIPPDPETPGGKDAGCAVFIDRQLAGPYGRSAGLYMSPPFRKGTKEQGEQSSLSPAQRYRQGLAALDKHCRAAHGGKPFAQLPDETKDEVLGGLETNKVQLEGVDGQEFFNLLLMNTQHGFFADPIYGGNRDMVAWKMIGFPGARYDYRGWVRRHNERYPLPPVSIIGRADWNPRAT